MGDDDEPEVGSEAWWERHRAEQAADRDRMDRVFGRRPEGQEHSAVVDHEALAATDPADEHDWQRLNAYLGLDALNPADPALPAPLRELLGDLRKEQFPVLAWASALATLIAAAGVGVANWGAGGLVLVAPFLPVSIGAAAVGTWVDGMLRRAGALPPLPTPVSRRDAALERLRAAPFVITVGGRLIENVPALSWLRARLDELDEAEGRCENRVGEIDRIVERLAELSDRLGERGPDPQRDALLALKKDEQALRKRVRALRKAIEARRTEMTVSLDRIRAAAEMATLRERSAELLGHTAPDAAAKVAADLELEVSDLRRDVDALRGDLADEEARWRAVSEVAALAR